MTTTNKPTLRKPILKHILINGFAKFINGMAKFKIQNRSLIYNVPYLIDFTLEYKVNSRDTVWKQVYFSEMTDASEFYVKFPLYLSPYLMDIKVVVEVSACAKCVAIRKQFGNIYEASNIETLHISPGVLFQSETEFKNGENIDYDVSDSTVSHRIFREGTIMNISVNNMVKVRPNDSYTHSSDIDTVHLSKIHKAKTHISTEYIMDITERQNAEIDLMLRINDNDSINVYKQLHLELEYIIGNVLHDMIDREEVCQDDFATNLMSTVIAINVVKYLFVENYNYRIKCIFDNSYLFYSQEWKYHLDFTCKSGGNVDQIQRFDDRSGTCGICRSIAIWNDFMYHCQCDNYQHVFCLTCIYSIVMQYEELETILLQILDGVITNDCIQEILVFCIGNISKFDVENDIDVNMIESKQNCNDSVRSVYVGSKRTIQMDGCNPDKKRQKLQ